MTMSRTPVSRRTVLKGAAITGAVSALPVSWTSARLAAAAVDPVGVTKFVDSLPLPGVLSPTAPGRYALTMRETAQQLHRQLPPTRLWGYNGGYPGPTIETRRGSRISLRVTNSLGSHLLGIDPEVHGVVPADAGRPRAAVHLHGGNVPPGSDGGPEDTFLPGASRTYDYPNSQQAATLWYHDHALGITRLNVMAGLAGFYLLRDDVETALGLPVGLPYEVPIVLQDRSLDADGQLIYPHHWMPEFFGDLAVVNGRAWPRLAVGRRLYRFRLLNGSNARFYNLRLSTGQPMWQIGTDGGLMAAPVRLPSLLLAPGERADVLVDFSRNARHTSVVLTNDAPSPFPNGEPPAAGMSVLMRFDVASTAAAPAYVPQPLAPFTRLTRGQAGSRRRTLTMVEQMNADGSVHSGLLNNLPFHTDRIERPRVDTLELWELVNLTADTHPIHLHLVQFQLLDRQAIDVDRYTARYNLRYPPPPLVAQDVAGAPRPPGANELGWKDTIRANPGEVTRILVPFGARAAAGLAVSGSYTGRYVWHCHILEHEDNEMMLPYEVVR